MNIINKTEQFVKRGFLRKYLDIFNAWIYRESVILKEYKINTYSSVISTLFSIFSLFLFLLIVESNFGDILNWGRVEIVFFSLFSFSIFFFIGVFSHSNGLKRMLLTGSFSIYLVRPVNVFYQHFLFSGRLRRVISGGIPLLSLILYLIFYSSVDWYRFLIGLLFSLYTGLFTLALYKMFESLAFFIKNNNFVWDNFEEIQNIYRSFPEPMLIGILKNIAIFIPFVYYSSYVTQYVFGYMDITRLIILGLYSTILTIFFSIVVFLLWHYGLKKYEAFG